MMNLGCTLWASALILLGATGVGIVKHLSLPWWVGFSPFGALIVVVIIRGVWDYYRRPRLLSGGRSKAQIRSDMRKGAKDANTTSDGIRQPADGSPKPSR